MKKHLYTGIGIAAFIIGGILARDKALEGAEKVEEFFSHKDKPVPPAPVAE